MSVVCGLDQRDVPGGFTVLTWRVSEGDDYKSGFVRIVTLDQSKYSLREQTLARLILDSTHLASTQLASGKT